MILVISTISPTTTASTCDAIAICDEPNHQNSPNLCSDGEGGAFITWIDNRSGLGYDIYAQKVNVNRSLLWDHNGITVCTEDGDQQSQEICTDGEGGAIIIWEDERIESDWDIYGQRIDANGDILWNVSGILVSKRGGYPQICSDNLGGAIIVWEHSKDIYAQRLNSNGTVMWGNNGIVICNATDYQWFPQFFCDDTGNSFFTWQDSRKGLGDPDIFAQKVDINGITQWQPNGTEICTNNKHQLYPQICTDGSEGAIINWVDAREPIHLYAQRINSTGDAKWISNGTAVAYTGGLPAAMCSDGEGGAIIAFRHIFANLYAHRINASGTVLFSSLLYDAVAAESFPINWKICRDYEGGAFIAWLDPNPPSSPTPPEYDIKAQHVDLNGRVFWSTKGKVVDTNTHSMSICSNELGGAFISWGDYRNGNNCDIYMCLLEKIREEEMAIWFGNFYLLITVLSIMALIVIVKRYISQSPKI